MRQRAALGALSLIVVVSLAVAVVRTRTAPAPPAVARASPAPVTAAVPSAPPLDPDGLRDIFRFGDEHSLPPRPRPELLERPSSGTDDPQLSGPRLVGLVRRSGRLLAALDLNGQVELAGPGDSVGGVTVLSVSEDAVRVRRADGAEASLPY